MFYLTTHSTHFIYGYMDRIGAGKERFYLMTHSTHFIYGYMASDRIGAIPLCHCVCCLLMMLML